MRGESAENLRTTEQAAGSSKHEVRPRGLKAVLFLKLYAALKRALFHGTTCIIRSPGSMKSRPCTKSRFTVYAEKAAHIERHHYGTDQQHRIG